jgi:alkanesulfonate monooxygenase SsuD/methylene tetrahydromethanopterin reductase-like flavin-dependent oxidoreductase (luciferase family)
VFLNLQHSVTLTEYEGAYIISDKKRGIVSVMSQEYDLHQSLPAGEVSQRPMRDRIGILINARDSADAIVKIREAEDAGILQVWSQSAGLADILTTFAAVAAQTRRIRLGTSIIPVYPLHPLKLAQQVLAVHDLAPGRLRLGIGPGNPVLIKDWYGLAQTSPLPYLKEYLEILRGILWYGTTSYEGEFFHISSDNIASRTMAPLLRKAQVPLLISAVGPKAFRLAGEVSDGAISWACPVPYLLDQAQPALYAGAEARQRSAPPLIAHIPVAMSTDEAAILAVSRPIVQNAMRFGPYAQMYVKAGFARAVNGDEDELDRLIRAQVVSGDEMTVRNRLKELLASGLDELLLQLRPIADEAKEQHQLLQLVGSL